MRAAAGRGTAAVLAVDGGDLPLGGGLLALLRPALDRLAPGGVLALVSAAPSLRDDLPAWCRHEGHEHLGVEAEADGGDRHLVARGHRSVPVGEREEGLALVPRGGRLGAADMLRLVPMPERADPSTGFAPRGARVEPGGEAYPFRVLDLGHAAPPDVAMLYEQAVAAQWDGARDVPWAEVGRHEPELEAAVCQVMTFLAENELSALYVPARFLPRIHPYYVETAQLLAMQLADEARHIDVFLKRARAGGGGAGVSSVTTSRSLRSLLEVEDFTEATFLLSVLGEGTFLDLLRFVAAHAPDEATRVLVRRAHADETRHVHFGLAHVRHALGGDPALYRRLEAAVRRRAARLEGTAGVPAPLQDALTVLAAGGTRPAALRRGQEEFRALLESMAGSRVRRLESAGFTREQAEELSSLHTPNFM